jgi:hypothetical protein
MQRTRTQTSRLLGLVSAWAGGFWVIVWEPRHLWIAVAASAAVVTAGSRAVLRFWPNALTLHDAQSWKRLGLHLAAGAALSYVAMVLAVAAIGAIFIPPLPAHKFEIVTLIALWLPLWFVPLGGAAVGSAISRRVAKTQS